MLGQALGDDVARQHGVDRDALGRQLDRGGAHEAELGGLARAVVRPAGEPGDRAGDRRGEDDPAAAGRGQGGQAGLHRRASCPSGWCRSTWSMSASVMSASCTSGKIPALAQSTSMPPSRSTARRRPSAAQSSRLATSASTTRPRRPPSAGRARSRPRPRAASASRPVIRTFAPGAREHAGDALADPAGAAGDHHGAACDRCEHASSSGARRVSSSLGSDR